MAPLKRLPAEAYRLAETYQLGTPTTIYRSSSMKMILALLLYLIIASLGAVFFLVGFAMIFSSRADNRLLLIGLGLPVGLIFLGIGIVAINSALKNRKPNFRGYICTDGFVHLKDNTVEAVRWDQIQRAGRRVSEGTNGRDSSNMITYTVLTAGRTTINIDSEIPYYQKLGAAIEQEITRRRLPQAIATYKTGMPVFFGSVSIGQQGVSNSKEMLPWTEISNVSLVGDKIRFNRKNPSLPSLDIPLSEIPDVCVFEALVAEILRGQR